MPTAVVILPSGTYRAADFVAAAADLGIDLIIASDSGADLDGLTGERVLGVDCGDDETAAEAIVALAGRRAVDAIVPADDRGVVIAALAARRLGLPHNDPDAARATRDKSVMRARLESGGVPQPVFRVLEPTDPVDPGEVGFPCVVKPLHLSGSRGVIRADDPAGLETAVARARSILVEAGEADHRLLVEEYVPGFEVAVEGLLTPAGLEVLAVLDKPDPMEGPYFEETVFVTPSRLAAAVVDRITAVVAAATAALGLSFGPVHAEVRSDGDAVRVIEIAARSIGGLCSRSLRFGMLDQASLEGLLLRAALGLPRRGMRRRTRASGVMMLPIPATGVLRRVGWREAALEVPGITALEITIPIGGRVRALPEGDRYLGFLFAEGDEADDVERSLREAHGLLSIEITEDGDR
jgi:biotin carboxylase